MDLGAKAIPATHNTIFSFSLSIQLSTRYLLNLKSITKYFRIPHRTASPSGLQNSSLAPRLVIEKKPIQFITEAVVVFSPTQLNTQYLFIGKSSGVSFVCTKIECWSEKSLCDRSLKLQFPGTLAQPFVGSLCTFSSHHRRLFTAGAPKVFFLCLLHQAATQMMKQFS